ncbi:MAG: hypothetical protein KTR21_14285 [Rhodobacteraceae bacterium]|nr:hypothetical protein [Paracoccaceae bacterium]
MDPENDGSVFLMQDGLAVIQAEDGEFLIPDAPGNDTWRLTKQFDGAKGDGVMLFDTNKDYFGNNNAGSEQTGPIKYTFKVEGDPADVAGEYFITLRGIKPATGEPNDRNNDFFVATSKDGEDPSNWKKLFFSGGPEKFIWGQTFDYNHEKSPAKFQIDGPGLYSIYISGRSRQAGLDEIHIQKGKFNKDADAPTSPLTDRNVTIIEPEPEPEPEPTLGAISGNLVEPKDGVTQSPDVKDAPVVLIDDFGDKIASVRTDSTGAYTFDLLPAGKYFIRHEGTGAEVEATLAEGETLAALELEAVSPQPTDAGDIFGTFEADELLGSSGDNRLEGYGSDDKIYGRSGDDQVQAGVGNDFAAGGEGDDEIRGGDGDDTVMGNVGTDAVYGEAGNDEVYGGAGDDEVYGGAGDDLVIGQSGNDQVYGGAGDDIVIGRSGDDVLSGGGGADLLLGGVDNDILRGDNGADRLRGGEGDDQLFGGAGDDLVIGDVGDDVIEGGLGDDILGGGLGADDFVYNPGDGFDIIRDFRTGEDTIDLRALSLERSDVSLRSAGDGVRLEAGDVSIHLKGHDLDELPVDFLQSDILI